MSSSALTTTKCKVEGRKYVLVPQPSRWQKKRERVVVQSPVLNLSKDLSLVPVRRFNGEQQNAVCFLPRTDFEKDSSESYQRLHVNKSPLSIEAHGIAICDSSPCEDFSYRRNDRFWIHVGSKTEEYKNAIPVINLRTCQSGLIQVDHVCWLPKIRSTSMCSERKAPHEQLWTPGGSARQCKLSGSKKYALWSFVVCQYTDGTKPIGKSVMIPAKDNQTEETRLLSTNESNALLASCWKLVMAGLGDYWHPESRKFLLPTPPASPKLDIRRQISVNTQAQTNSVVPVPGSKDCWARIKVMATCRAAQGNQYVLRNSPIHPQTLCLAGSEDRGCLSSIGLPDTDCESDCGSDLDSISTWSRDDSSLRMSDAEKQEKTQKGQRLHEGIIFFEFAQRCNANGNVEDIPDRLAFSAADPSIANDPTLIRAEWEAHPPVRNRKLDGLCQDNDPHCPYTTNWTCKHYHPDPAKCRLDKDPLLEFFEPSSARLSNQWDLWYEANRYNLQQNRHMDHEHCVTRLRPYPAGAGECLLASSLKKNHRCCNWKDDDLDGIPQNFTRDSNRSKHDEAKRHRIEIFDQSTLVKPEIRLPDDGIMESQLDPAGQMFQKDIGHGSFGSDLGDLMMGMDTFGSDDSLQDWVNFEADLGCY